MFRRWRLRKIHGVFLESCRKLDKTRTYWSQAGSLTRWFLQLITPVPLLSLDKDGQDMFLALQWLEAHCQRLPLGESELRNYHQILNGGEREGGGQYRMNEVIVKDSAVRRPSPKKIPLLMKQLDMRLRQEQEILDAMRPVNEAALLRVAVGIHQRIAFVHPFQDANGRVARLAMNHLLRRYGMGYVILPPLTESKEHFDALEDAHGGKLDRLSELAMKCLHSV